jgi:hypothetical protein
MLYVTFDSADGLTQQDADDFVLAIDSAFGYPKNETDHHTFSNKHPILNLWRVDVSIQDPDSRMFPLDVVIPIDLALIENISPGNSYWNPPMLP